MTWRWQYIFGSVTQPRGWVKVTCIRQDRLDGLLQDNGRLHDYLHLDNHIIRSTVACGFNLPLYVQDIIMRLESIRPYFSHPWMHLRSNYLIPKNVNYTNRTLLPFCAICWWPIRNTDEALTTGNLLTLIGAMIIPQILVRSHPGLYARELTNSALIPLSLKSQRCSYLSHFHRTDTWHLLSVETLAI